MSVELYFPDFSRVFTRVTDAGKHGKWITFQCIIVSSGGIYKYIVKLLTFIMIMWYSSFLWILRDSEPLARLVSETYCDLLFELRTNEFFFIIRSLPFFLNIELLPHTYHLFFFFFHSFSFLSFSAEMFLLFPYFLFIPSLFLTSISPISSSWN